MKMNKKRGMSLIVLVITIVVVIILVATIMIKTRSNNPINKADEAALRKDIYTIQEELSIKVSNEIVDVEVGDINKFDGPAEDCLETASKYKGKFYIFNGELMIIEDKTNDKEKSIAEEFGITVYNGN